MMTDRRKKEMPTGERSGRQTLRWKLTGFVFSVMTVSVGVIVLIYWIVLTILGNSALGLRLAVSPIFIAALLLGACALIATVLFALLSKYYLQPIKQLIRATKEIGEGHFDIRVQENRQHPYYIVPELQDLIRNFNEMAEELRGIELFRNDFINNFSHEFKTPIISIRGFAHELRQEDLTDAQRTEYAKIIEEESDRLARLSSNVLTLSKLENQQIITGQTEFYLDEQLRQCILLYESEWSEKDLEVIPELEEVRYRGNEEMLMPVWRNLIGNAIKFTPRGGWIRVGMTVDEQTVTVTVADNGIGMSPEVQARIFEKFYQGDPSHSHAGYGVGLALVHRILELMEGTITVESREGEGSCFTVLLPRTP